MNQSRKVLILLAIVALILGVTIAANETTNDIAKLTTSGEAQTDYWLVGGYLLILLFVASAPTILDTIGAYILAFRTSEKPSGISGVTRGTIAVTIIVVLGIAMIQMMVVDPETYHEEQINNVLSVLAGLVAAVSGFYFGGKAAEQKTMDLEDPLHKLKQLRDSNLITQEDYDKKKIEFLSKMKF